MSSHSFNLVEPQPLVSTRSTVGIIISCLTTLIPTSTVVIRSNVTTSRWRRYTQPPFGFALGLFMPNLALWSAVSQYGRARIIRDRVNIAAHKHLDLTQTAGGAGAELIPNLNRHLSCLQRLIRILVIISVKAKHLFRCVFKREPKFYQLKFKRGDKTIHCRFERWTLIQGFYADMGGYRSRLPLTEPFQEEQEQPRSVPLAAKTILKLAEEGSMFDVMNFPADEISLTKDAITWTTLFCVTRAVYFAATCIRRSTLGQTIALLEVATTAHVFIALCIQFFWWSKPPYVGEGHCLDVSAEAAVPELSQELQDQLHGRTHIAYAYTIPKRLDMMMWYRADDQAISQENANYRACIVFPIAGLHAMIHLLPWRVCFPTPTDRTVWVTSLSYICALACIVFVLAAVDLGARLLCTHSKRFSTYWFRDGSSGSHFGNTIRTRNVLNKALYCLAPPAVLALSVVYWESVWSFRDQPQDLYS